jgi:hypothetical protein
VASEHGPRQIAAILAADVVGYSPLMGEDEEGASMPAVTCTTDLHANGASRSVDRVARNDRLRVFRDDRSYIRIAHPRGLGSRRN